MTSSSVSPVAHRKGLRSSVADDRHREPVRISTRGPIKRIAPIDDSTSFAAFVRALRASNDVPLVIVAVGDVADANGALARFARAIDRELTVSDATWIVARQGGALPFGVIGGTVVTLDASEESDQRIWKNLVADILFFSADQEEDEMAVAAFAECAPCVIVPADAPHLRSFGTRSVEAGLPVLTFRSADDTITSAKPDTFWNLAAPLDGPLGEHLLRVARQLATHQNRRRLFAAILQSFHPTDIDDDAWGREVIVLADRHRWPRWTVGSMPRRYVMASNGETPRRAYLWRLIYDCFAQLKIDVESELCDGEVLIISAADDVHSLIAEMNQRIDTEFQTITYAGDTPLFGRLGDVLAEISYKWTEELPDLSRDIRRIIAQVTGRQW